MNLPAILDEERERLVAERPVRPPDALDKGLRQAQPVGLHGGHAGDRHADKRAGQTQVRGSQPAKVHHAAEVQLEDLQFLRAELNQVGIAADLERVAPGQPGQVVAPLEAPLDAVHGRERFAAEEGKAGDLRAHAVAARELRKAVVEAAAGKLKAQLIEKGSGEAGGVPAYDGQVARLLERRAGSRVLPEVLVLRVHLNAGHQRGRNAHAHERAVARIPGMVQPPGPQAGSFGDRIIAAR